MGAHQDPVVLAAHQLLDGAAQGEGLPRPVGAEDDDGAQGELQGCRDGPHCLPLLGVQPLVLVSWPLSSGVPGDGGRPTGIRAMNKLLRS